MSPASALGSAARSGSALVTAARIPGRVVRRLLTVADERPLLPAEIQLDIGGRADVPTDTSLVIVANHASRLDLAVLLAALPAEVRKRTVLGNSGEAMLLGTAPDSGRPTRAVHTVAASLLNTVTKPGRVLSGGDNVVIFPEGGRSAGAYPGPFQPAAAQLAIEHRVPVLPVAIRGSFAAMPRGQVRPRPGRSRVSVRFGTVVAADPGESADQLTERLSTAVRQLIAEDVTTWWQSRLDPDAIQQPTPAPPGSWRRIWEQSDEPTQGGRPPRLKIWH